MIDISWAENISKTKYTAHIRIECQDRVGILRDILMKTGDLGINIVYSNTYLKGRKFGIIDLGIELDTIETLKKYILAIQAINDVFSVRRLQQKENLNQPKPIKKKKQKQVQNQGNKQNNESFS